VLGAGAAAAIAAVFSAPIGAVIFGHELISRRFDRTGTGAMLASAFTAWWVSHRLFDLQPLFVPDHLPRLAGVHLSAALLLGLACGLVASAFIALARHAPRLALASRLPRRWQPLVPAALLFAMSPVLPHLLGPGLDAVAMAIDGRLTITLIVLLLAAKLVVTPVCLGFGLHGGTFAPALLLGALTAGLVSQLMPEAGGAGLALVGAAGCVAAVIGAPIATVVIVFELTGSYPWAVMSMVTVVAGAQIARVLAGPSLFDPPGR
jgi:CIC family chloride channel protein